MEMDDKLFGTYLKATTVQIAFETGDITYQMKPNDLLVRVNDLSIAGTITLPPVVECAGRIYSIRDCGGLTSSYNVTIQDKDDSRDWSDDTLDSAEDSLLLYSDGEKWHKILDDT